MKIDQQRTVLEAIVTSESGQVQDRVLGAIDNASQRSQQGQTMIKAQLANLHTSDVQIRLESQESRNQVLQSISCSEESSRLQCEEMTAEITRQWKSAEQQIARLREDIKQIEIKIADSIRQAVSNKGKQKELNDQTNLLYKIWAAKDLMLLKLLVCSTLLYRCSSPFVY